MSRPWQASGRGADLLFLCVSATALSVQVILQHREAQPQPTMHSCHFRSSNESLYHSHHGLVADFASDRAGDRTLVVCVGGEKQATTPPSRDAATNEIVDFGRAFLRTTRRIELIITI